LLPGELELDAKQVAIVTGSTLNLLNTRKTSSYRVRLTPHGRDDGKTIYQLRLFNEAGEPEKGEAKLFKRTWKTAFGQRISLNLSAQK
jgi:hypothetical protein